MLVLSRKPLESVLIGSGVRVTILKVDRNQVRIGIEAPKDVSVLRSELVLDLGDAVGPSPDACPEAKAEAVRVNLPRPTPAPRVWG